MKGKMKSIMLIGCGLLTLASCDKEELANDTVVVNNTTNTRAFEARAMGPYLEMTEIRKDERFLDFYNGTMDSRTQWFSVNANSQFTVVGDQGTKLICSANNFEHIGGGMVEGMIDIELVEVYNKADMILLDKATSALTEDGSAIDALVSAGEVYVRAYQGGTEINLISPMTVEITTATFNPDMVKYVEVDGTGDDLLWELAADEDVDVREGGEGDFVTAYDILPGEWGWTNLDFMYSDPCAKTDIFVEVPVGYDPSNTEIYLSFDGDPGRLANFDTWDGTMFTEHYGQICIGIDCHFVAVTNIGGVLEYGIQPATIVSGHVEVFTGFTPITEADLISEINALP